MVHIGVKGQADCGAPIFLRIVSIVGASMWLLQTMFGVLAKRNTRKPPYLYSPERPGGLPGVRNLRQLLRRLGTLAMPRLEVSVMHAFCGASRSNGRAV